MKKTFFFLFICLSTYLFSYPGEMYFHLKVANTGTFDLVITQLSTNAWELDESTNQVIVYSGSFNRSVYNSNGVLYQAPDSDDMGHENMMPWASYRITITTHPNQGTSATITFDLDCLDRNWCGGYAHPDTEFLIDMATGTVEAYMYSIPDDYRNLYHNGSYTMWDLWDSGSPVTTPFVIPFSASISGISAYTSKGLFTWTANATGGTGTYTYQWRERFSTSDPWSAVVSTYSTRTKMLYSGDYFLQLVVTSGTQTVTVYKNVYYGFIKSSDENPDGLQNNVFSLGQNYPNPFNPSTVISYSLARASNVSVVVYNAAGEKVDELVNSFNGAGLHNVVFNAANRPSGIYYYTIKTPYFTQTKKMLLVK